jgi:uncharacterized delta-60 repeat protein
MATALLILSTTSHSLARPRPGSLDQSFGTHGRVTQVIDLDPEAYIPLTRYAVDPSGKILVEVGLDIFRYRQDGELDRGFGEGGQVTLAVPAGLRFESGGMTVDSRGRVLVDGTTIPSSSDPIPFELSSSPQPASATVFRFTTAGQPDPDFGTNGTASTDLGLPPIEGERARETPALQVVGLAVDAKNRPILTGRVVTHTGQCRDQMSPFWLHTAFVARLTTHGSLDSGFHRIGVRIYNGLSSAVSPIAEAGGGVVYEGRRGDCEAGYSVLARIGPKGNPDTSFGPRGRRPMGSSGWLFGGFAVDRVGQIFVELRRNPSLSRHVDAIERLRPNGALDTSFGRDGTAKTRLGPNTHLEAIAVDSHNRVLRAGWRGTRACPNCKTGPRRGHASFALLRLRADGTPDRRFGRNGMAFTAFGGDFEAIGEDVLIDRRGRILVAGLLYTASLASDGTSPTSVVRRFALARYIG